MPKVKNSPIKKRLLKTLRRKEVLLSGAAGRMGVELQNMLRQSADYRLGAAVDSDCIKVFDNEHTAILRNDQKSLNAVAQCAEIIIDFSSPSGTRALTKALKNVDSNGPGHVVLIGTTGLSALDIKSLRDAAKKGQHKILVTGNTSLGVATLAKLANLAAKQLAPAGFDIEIIESHHNRKLDAPSGTALLLANVITNALPNYKIQTSRNGKRSNHTIGIHAVRGGGIVGEHEIRFISDFEEVSLSHRAFDRALFAAGTLNLLRDLDAQLKPGQLMEFSDFLLL